MRIFLKNIESELKLTEHITPHMFRHTFATTLLEKDVDIRYHHAYGGGVRRRGRRKYPFEAYSKRRLRHRARAARHHLYRRNRQDCAQERKRLHYPRRIGRGRAAGAFEDHRKHARFRSPSGRQKTPPAGVSQNRHDEYSVYLRRGFRGPG